MFASWKKVIYFIIKNIKSYNLFHLVHEEFVVAVLFTLNHYSILQELNTTGPGLYSMQKNTESET